MNKGRVGRAAQSYSLLVVDDDRAMREMLGQLFREEGYGVEEVASADEALERSRDEEFDAVLSDIKMPGKSGIELVAELRQLRPDTPVVLMTAFGTIDSAVEAMRVGALDYITKPFEPDAVLVTIERALERRALERENRLLRRAVDRTSKLGVLIGTSPAMREIFSLIRRVAHSRSSILITGGWEPLGSGRHAHHRDFEQGPARRDRKGKFSRRPLLGASCCSAGHRSQDAVPPRGAQGPRDED